MKIFIITGQTAAGKTDLAIRLAAETNAEIINFDSRQVYKHLDVVTGKDFEKPEFHKTDSLDGFDVGYYMVQGIRIWLYDIVDPKSYFSSFDYCSCALHVLLDIKKRGKNAVLTGGTYLYLYHLLYRIDTENIKPDMTLRSKLSTADAEELRHELKKINPSLLENLNASERNNPQRLIRKIEIARHYAGAGKKIPVLMKHQYKKTPGEIADFIGLVFENREKVRKTIQMRVKKRITQGALEEVRKLLKSGYGMEDPGLKTIGYPELMRHLSGELSLAEAEELWTTHEVQYTKRQLTFMKKDPHIRWITV